jgi:hypothetical protein
LRPRAGWIAAVLLIALVFLGGPDILHDKPHAKIAAAKSAAERQHRAGDDVESQHSTPEHTKLIRSRISALPPSRQSHAMPAQSAGAGALLTPRPSGSVADGHPWRHLTICSPETLQVFRC